MYFNKQTLRILLTVVCLGTTSAMLDACPWFCCGRHRASATSAAQKAAEQKTPLKQPQISRIEVEPFIEVKPFYDEDENVAKRANCAQRFLNWFEETMSRLISIKRLSNAKIWRDIKETMN